MKLNNPMMIRTSGAELLRRRAVVMPGQRSVFFHHMEVQLPDQPIVLSKLPQFTLDPRSASLSLPLVLRKMVFVYSTVERSLKMWLTGDAQTRLTSLNSIPLL